MKNILQSITDKLASGNMSVRQAREELCQAGWFNYLPSEEQVNKLLSR